MRLRDAKAARRAAREAILLARKGDPYGAVRGAMRAARGCGRAVAQDDPLAPEVCGDAGGAATQVARAVYGDQTALNDAHDAAYNCGSERTNQACFRAIMAEKHALDVLDALRAGRGRMLNRARRRAGAQARRLTGAARARRMPPC